MPPLESTMRQLSQLNEAIIEAALTAALRKVQETKAWPQRLDPRTMRVGVIALGDLGAGESSYFSPLELLFVYEAAVVDAAALRTSPRTIRPRRSAYAPILNKASPPEARSPLD